MKRSRQDAGATKSSGPPNLGVWRKRRSGDFGARIANEGGTRLRSESLQRMFRTRRKNRERFFDCVCRPKIMNTQTFGNRRTSTRFAQNDNKMPG